MAKKYCKISSICRFPLVELYLYTVQPKRSYLLRCCLSHKWAQSSSWPKTHELSFLKNNRFTQFGCEILTLRFTFFFRNIFWTEKQNPENFRFLDVCFTHFVFRIWWSYQEARKERRRRRQMAFLFLEVTTWTMSPRSVHPVIPGIIMSTSSFYQKWFRSRCLEIATFLNIREGRCTVDLSHNGAVLFQWIFM